MQLFVAVLRKLSFLFVILFCSRSSLAQDLVLSGTVVTPDRVLAKGWVVIKDGRILSILEKAPDRSEEHTSELQSHLNLVCRLLLEKKKKGVFTTLITQDPATEANIAID